MKLSLFSWARQACASCVVALSIGWGMPLSLPPAHGLGTERTTLEGNMLDCSDSGMLVGVSIKDHNNKLGKCPLKHSDVSANISGYVARVTVKQQFHNPFNEFENLLV